MKAVGYPRVSTYSQDTRGYSLEDQVTSIESFCDDKKIELVAHFMERESAATIENRPAFLDALEFLYKSPEVEAIIVTNLDRFSRSVLDSEILKRDLARHGKRLISIQEQYLTPISLVSEDDDYLEGALQHRMVEAEQERKRIRKRFLRGKKAKSAGGGWIGFRPPFEYDVIQGELVYNRERAVVVRHIRRLRYWLGWTYTRIRDYLNGENFYPTDKGTRGRKFPPPHLAKAPMRKRNRPLVRGNGQWQTWSVRNIIMTDRNWGSTTNRQGRLKAK